MPPRVVRMPAAALAFELFGFVGVEHDLTGGGTWRRRQAACHHVLVRGGVDGRMQQLIERARVDAHDGLLGIDHALAAQLDGDAQRRLSCALA